MAPIDSPTKRLGLQKFHVFFCPSLSFLAGIIMEKQEDLEIKTVSSETIESINETSNISSNVEEAQATQVISLDSLSLQSNETVKSDTTPLETSIFTPSKPVKQEISLANRQTKHLASGTNIIFLIRIYL